MSKYWRKIVLTIVFAIFFGLLESIVAVYLRYLYGSVNTLVNPQITDKDIFFSLGFVAFLKPEASLLVTQSLRFLLLELLREFSTIAMLITLAFIAGKTIKEKLAYFFLVFGIWDISYYVFLKILVNWPSNLFEPDVYFLIPVAWVGPVITPLSTSCIMILPALFLLSRGSKLVNFVI